MNRMNQCPVEIRDLNLVTRTLCRRTTNTTAIFAFSALCFFVVGSSCLAGTFLTSSGVFQATAVFASSESTDLFDIPVPTETPKTENSVDLDDIENMESGFASPSADKTKEAVQAEKQKDVETLGAQKEQEKGEAAQKKEAARLKKDEARQKEKAALEKKQEVALEGDEILKEGDAVVETKHPAKQRNLSLVITAAELKNREIASHYVWKDRDDLESVAEKLYGDPALFPLLVDANEGDIILPDNLVRGTRLHVPRPPENDKKLDDIRRKSDKDPYRGWEGATLRRARH
jgi:hypothetical protein